MRTIASRSFSRCLSRYSSSSSSSPRSPSLFRFGSNPSFFRFDTEVDTVSNSKFLRNLNFNSLCENRGGMSFRRFLHTTSESFDFDSPLFKVLSSGDPSDHNSPVTVDGTFILESISSQERDLFDFLQQVNSHFQLSLTLRVAGGWVRDHFLERLETHRSKLHQNEIDIDIALDKMTGAHFVEYVKKYEDFLETQPKSNSPTCSSLKLDSDSPSDNLSSTALKPDSNDNVLDTVSNSNFDRNQNSNSRSDNLSDTALKEDWNSHFR